MFARVLPLVLLCACAPGVEPGSPDATDSRPSTEGPDYAYVLGTDPASGEVKTGGAHRVVDFSTHREAIDYANQPTQVHPELDGVAATFDPNLVSGETDWPVFASSWWSQENNGIAYRFAGSNSDISDHGDVDELSPIEKYDALVHPGQTQTVASVEHWNYDELHEDVSNRGDAHSHPEVTAIGPATAWELENHGVYQDWAHPDNWWGHCNGWASYATTDAGGAPERDVYVRYDSGDIVECTPGEEGCILFRMGDIEALMTELYFSDTSTFGGSRCEENPEDMELDEHGRPVDPDCRDLNPGSFHVAVTGLLSLGAEHLGSGQIGRPAFVIDHNYDSEVWNFPLVSYEIHETEEVSEEEANALVGATGSDYLWNSTAVRFVRVDLTYSMVSDSVDASTMLEHAHDRNVPLHDVDLHYVLELDANDTVLGGEWIEDPTSSWGENSKQLHPDFMWMAIDAVGYGESSDDLSGDDDNPYLAYSDVRAILDCANDPSTCGGTDSGDTDVIPPGDDDDSAGGSVDCGGCAGRVEGPMPYGMAIFSVVTLLLRRRRTKIPFLG